MRGHPPAAAAGTTQVQAKGKGKARFRQNMQQGAPTPMNVQQQAVSKWWQR